MGKGGSKLTIILVSVIVILAGTLVYGVYTGFKVKAELGRLNGEITDLTTEKNDMMTKMSECEDKYHLMEMDISKIYKTCPYENACKGRFPGISWYCNDKGDYSPDNANAPYICVCDADCKITLTPKTD